MLYKFQIEREKNDTRYMFEEAFFPAACAPTLKSNFITLYIYEEDAVMCDADDMYADVTSTKVSFFVSTPKKIVMWKFVLMKNDVDISRSFCASFVSTNIVEKDRQTQVHQLKYVYIRVEKGRFGKWQVYKHLLKLYSFIY